MIEAGFSNINAAVMRLEKEIPDVTSFARGLVHGNPLIDQIRMRGGVEPDRVVDAVAQALREEFGGDPGRMPLQAIVFSAVTAYLTATAARSQPWLKARIRPCVFRPGTGHRWR